MGYDDFQSKEAGEQPPARSFSDDELGAWDLTEIDVVLPSDRFAD